MKNEKKNNRLPFNRRRREISNIIGISVYILLLVGLFLFTSNRVVPTQFKIVLVIVSSWGIIHTIKELYKWHKLLFAEDGLYKENYKWFQNKPYEVQSMVKWRDVRYIELQSYYFQHSYHCNTIIIHGTSPKKTFHLSLDDYYCDDWPGTQYDQRLIELLEPICHNNGFALKLN